MVTQPICAIGTCLLVKTKGSIPIALFGPRNYMDYHQIQQQRHQQIQSQSQIQFPSVNGLSISLHTSPSLLLVTVDNRSEAQAYIGLRMIWPGIYWHLGRGTQSKRFWRILKFHVLTSCKTNALLRQPFLNPIPAVLTGLRLSLDDEKLKSSRNML